MKRMLVLAVGLILVGSTAQAQYVPPSLPGYGNQMASPYLNLLQPNVNPVVTYAGIVQPQLQAQSTFEQMQNQINLARTMPGGVAPPRNGGISDTGTAPARFMQYQQYFNTTYGQRRVNYQTQAGTGAAVYGQR